MPLRGVGFSFWCVIMDDLASVKMTSYFYYELPLSSLGAKAVVVLKSLKLASTLRLSSITIMVDLSSLVAILNQEELLMPEILNFLVDNDDLDVALKYENM